VCKIEEIMRIVLIYNQDLDNVINKLGVQNQEKYDEETIKRIEKVLKDRGYDVMIIDGNLDMFEILREVIAKEDRIPFVFNMAYGIQGESRYSHIPSILEMLGLPYLGSGPFGHAMALDKVVSKILMKNHNIPTPDFMQINSPDELDQITEFPVIIKPVMDAGSFGLKKVNNHDELKEAASSLMKKYSQAFFIEKIITGKEFALGLLGNDENIECLPLIEINLENVPDGIYDSNQKKVRPETRAAELPDHIINDMQEKAIKLYRTLRLRDYARVDIRFDENDNFWFLEINSMAGLRTTGLFMSAAGIAGFTYEEMIIRLLDVAINKYFKERPELISRYELYP
jgi:D-alanine-D-alanine ligase